MPAASGPKLKDSTATDTPPAPGVQATAPPLAPGRGIRGMKMASDGCPETPPAATGRAGSLMIMTPNGECMISNGQTMDGLAHELSNRFDRPVIDQTGLKGKYDLRLRYDPSSMPGGRGGPGMRKDVRDDTGAEPAGGDPANGIAPGGGPPSIFSALQEQLGLKLEARKGPVDLLVIDHVEKKPAN